VLVVLLVPIVNSTGAIVEQHVRAVRMDPLLAGDVDARTLTRLAGPALARSMAARVARVTRALTGRGEAEVSIEAAIGALVHSLTAPEETQLTLFSQRERMDFDHARRRADTGVAAQAARIADLSAARTVVATEPLIVAVFDGVGKPC